MDVEVLIREVTEKVLSALHAQKPRFQDPALTGPRNPSSLSYGTIQDTSSDSTAVLGPNGASTGMNRRPTFLEAEPSPSSPRPRRLLLLLPVPSPRLPRLAELTTSLALDGWEPYSLRGADSIAEAKAGGFGASFPRDEQLSPGLLSALLSTTTPGDVVVLGTLGFGLAGRLSRLEDDDIFVRAIVSARLRGIPVLVLRDDLEAASGIVGEIPRRAGSLLRDIERLGLEVLPVAELATRLDGIASTRSVAARDMNGLLTEAEVEKLHESGQRRLVLPAGTLVTPLARTRAGDLDIELVEKRED